MVNPVILQTTITSIIQFQRFHEWIPHRIPNFSPKNKSQFVR